MLEVVVESALNFNLEECEPPIRNRNKQWAEEVSYSENEEGHIPVAIVGVEPGVDDVHWYDCY